MACNVIFLRASCFSPVKYLNLLKTIRDVTVRQGHNKEMKEESHIWGKIADEAYYDFFYELDWT